MTVFGGAISSSAVYGSKWIYGPIEPFDNLGISSGKDTGVSEYLTLNLEMNTLKIGDKAPQFKAKDQNGTVHELKDYQGKKLVVFFYPAADTPGCTKEACNLRDNYHLLKENGYELLGVSADTAAKQGKFIAKYNLPFALIADEDHALINAFGVWGPKKFMGREYEGIHRMTFVIDENGLIEQIIDKVVTKDHAAQIL